FTGPQLLPAAEGKPNSIVVFLHGYGANGDNLIPLGKAWASLLPHTLFVAPHGPAVAERNPFGNQWFSLPEWDPDRPLTATQLDEKLQEINQFVPAFNQYLDDLLKTYDLPPEKLALVGFSQGAMLALYLARQHPVGAVVAYSGAFLTDFSEGNGT